MAGYDPVSTVVERYKLALENQRDKFKKFNEFDYIFHSKLKYSDPNVPSKVFNPILWSFIETIMSRMLAKKPEISFKPRVPTSDDTDTQQAQIQSDLFSYWFDKSGAFMVLSDFIKQALIYGTAIIKVDWYTCPQRTVKSYVTDPMTGEAILDKKTGQFKTQETQVTDYDDPRIQNVNIYDFFIDPNATTMDDADWVIYQYYTTVKELEALNASVPDPIYNKKGLSELKKQELTGTRSEGEGYNQERRNAAGYSSGEGKIHKGKIKIWEMENKDGSVCIIGNESVLLRETDGIYWHPFKSYIRYVDSSNTLEFYGKGEIEPVEKMIHWLNTNINQRIVNISQILSPVWKAGNNVDDTELQFIPNSIIHLTDMSQVDILRQNDVTGSSFQEQQTIIETIQRTLGVTDYTQGLATPGQTASEVQIKTSQANTRFAAKLMLFEELALKRLGEIIYQLYQQFITKEKIIRVLGKEGEQFIRLTPMDLAGDYDVIPESGSTLLADEQESFNKFLNLASFVQGKPYVNQEAVDKELFTRAGEKEPDKFFMSDQQGQPGQQGPPMPPPPPPKPLVSISSKLNELTPMERAQALIKDGIQPDPQGPPPINGGLNGTVGAISSPNINPAPGQIG